MALHQHSKLPAEYDALHVGVLLYDQSGRVLDANPELEAVFGYSAAELRELSTGRYSANTFAGSEGELRERISAAAVAEPTPFKWRIKRADGELIWARFHLSHIELDGRPRVLAEVHDITDYYTAKRRVGLLSRLMRHNVRNDVNVISGTAQQIATLTADQQVRRQAETIRARAVDFAETTESIKQIEEATAAAETPERFERAAETLSGVVERVEATHPAAEISVEERTPMVIAAGNAVEYALEQAVENAVVHAEAPQPTVEISVDASPNTGRVEVRIADENPPIPTDELDALDEFAETTSTHHGSGVGLFVMKWCLESVGGELKVEPRDGGGNVVYFYLPPKGGS